MIVGASTPRIDGIEKVTGEAKFTGDLIMPGLLEAKVLRSPLPHALIESIDTSKAESVSGVIAILTREDLKDIDPYYGNCLRDRAIVAMDRVRFVGEPVAVVAAENALVAEEALSLIDVEYRELSCVPDMDAALAEGAPRLHDKVANSGEFHDVAGVGAEFGGNICHREQFVKGNPNTQFDGAEEIIEETFEFPMVCQYAMEPHTAIARVTHDGITLWSSSAHPFLVRSEIAHMFHLPHAKVEVIVPFVGGAYGSKSYFKIEPLVVAMARKTAGRPVRVVQSVSESMLTTRRHSARVRIKTGVKRNGTLVAREAEVVMDTGAYADNGPRVAKRADQPHDRPVQARALQSRRAGALHQHGAGRIDAFDRRAANHLGVGIAHGHDRRSPRYRSTGVSPAQSVAPRRGAETGRDTDRCRLMPGNECCRAIVELDRCAAAPKQRRRCRRRRFGLGSDACFGRLGAFARRRQRDIDRRHHRSRPRRAHDPLPDRRARIVDTRRTESRCAEPIRWRRLSIAPPARAARLRSWAAP